MRLRLANDAEFRDRVDTALTLANLELRRRTGKPMTEDEMAVATLAAGYALNQAEARFKASTT